jgi:hypothetical protein
LENGGYPSSNYSSTKRSSCGLQRQIKLSLSSKISYPSHQSSRLLAKGAATALPRCGYSRGQYCHRCWAAGRRPLLPSLVTSLLRQRGLVGI